MPVLTVSQWCAMACHSGRAWLTASAASARWACTADPGSELPRAFGDAAQDQPAGVGGDGRRERVAPPRQGVSGGGPAGLFGKSLGCVTEPFGGERDTHA